MLQIERRTCAHELYIPGKVRKRVNLLLERECVKTCLRIHISFAQHGGKRCSIPKFVLGSQHEFLILLTCKTERVKKDCVSLPLGILLVCKRNNVERKKATIIFSVSHDKNLNHLWNGWEWIRTDQICPIPFVIAIGWYLEPTQQWGLLPLQNLAVVLHYL